MADPAFGQTGKIDTLFGVDVFVDVLYHGWRNGPPCSLLRWNLVGYSVSKYFGNQINFQATTFHASVESSDDLLRKFWEVEESPGSPLALSQEERIVVQHFETNNSLTKEGRFVAPLPRKSEAKPIGESTSQAMPRFLYLEHSLTQNGRFQQCDAGIPRPKC